MYILTIRTDKPEAELGLYEDRRQISYQVWPAHRQLAETIHQKIAEVLAGTQLGLNDLGGIVAYRGPGSFTGLRIGLSVANALAAGCGIPIAGQTGYQEQWLERGLVRVLNGDNDHLVKPEYGAEPHITSPKK